MEKKIIRRILLSLSALGCFSSYSNAANNLNIEQEFAENELSSFEDRLESFTDQMNLI